MRKFIFLFLFLVVALSYIFKIDELLIKKFSFLNDIKSSYMTKMMNFSTILEKYFDQAASIENLKTENNQLKEYKILYTNTQNQLDTLKDFYPNIKILENHPKIEVVKVLSYVNYNDFTKVWLDKKISDDTIFGLLIDNYSAGIIVNKNGYAVGLLNGNKDCSYAVFIGANKAPGIITASNNPEELQIKFIPVGVEINEGDEVITSGIDNIFFEGLKVGRITEITNLADMKIATVKPYINVLKKKYFYSYDKGNKLTNFAQMKSESNDKNEEEKEE